MTTPWLIVTPRRQLLRYCWQNLHRYLFLNWWNCSIEPTMHAYLCIRRCRIDFCQPPLVSRVKLIWDTIARATFLGRNTRAIDPKFKRKTRSQSKLAGTESPCPFWNWRRCRVGLYRRHSTIIGGRRCSSRSYGVHESRSTEPRPACRPPEPWRSSSSSVCFVRAESFRVSSNENNRRCSYVTRRASRDVEACRIVCPGSARRCRGNVRVVAVSAERHRRRRRRGTRRGG